MAICSKCGKELADDAKFCASCGTPVGGAASEGSTAGIGDKAKAAADKMKEAAKSFNAEEAAKAAGEKAKAAGGKLKGLIDKLPFNGMAAKVPALAKVAGFANYAACALGVLLVVVVVAVATPDKGGNPAKGGKVGAETKAAEAAVKKEFGVSSEELIIAGVIAADDLDLENEIKEEDLAEFLSLYEMMSDSEKAATLELYQTAISVAFDKKEIAALMDKAKKKMKSIQKDIDERLAALDKIFKEFTSKDSVVKVGSVYVMKTEVPQGLYKAVTGMNPSEFKGNDYRPVEQVSWYDAVKFCNLLSERQGLKPCYSVNGSTNAGRWGNGGKDYYDYDVEVDESANGWRLPTEAEWEAAADDGHAYSGSDSIDDVAWHYKNSDRHTQKVGTKKPNTNGLYDMSGNVWEWCWDKSGSSLRVYRGGSWYNDAEYCAVAIRNSYIPDNRGSYLGFRLVRSAQ